MGNHEVIASITKNCNCTSLQCCDGKQKQGKFSGSKDKTMRVS